jgi:collagenase-like PrtC family protease
MGLSIGMKPELLVPVNKKTLDCALNNGADAVYFGVGHFNARRRATNFELADLKSTVIKCHEKGVRAYLTLNILVKNSEISSFFNVIKKAYSAGIDAIIIQEVSFVESIRKNFPGLEIHLSTQAAIYDAEQLNVISKVDRVILPRELSLEQIEAISKVVPVEVFVHGALCFAYSGKCLMSSFSGTERSGNRGMCAQPCRREYNEKYLLSMKDLMLVKQLKVLAKLGVVSFKIEGRLRSPQYVSEATRVYRKAIDEAVPNLENLKVAFNREFTEGFGFESNNLVNTRDPSNQGLFLGKVDEDIFVKLECDIAYGEGIAIIKKKKKEGAIVRRMEVKDQGVTKAKKGQKVWFDLYIEPGDLLFKTSYVGKDVGVKRDPIKLSKRKVVNVKLPKISEGKRDKSLLLVKVQTKEEGDKALEAGADRVFYSILAEDYDSKFGAYVPSFLGLRKIKLVRELLEKHKPSFVLGDNYGLLAKTNADEKYLDYSANVFNDLDVEFFNDKNLFPIISPELSFEDLKKFKDKRFGVLAHGRFPVMLTKNKITEEMLKDGKEFVYKVRKSEDNYEVLSSRPLGLFDLILDLEEEGIKVYLLDLDTKVQSSVRIYRDIIDNKRKTSERMKKGFTLGHFDISVA